MKKRILITGSGGFLGSRLAEYFEGKDGYETVAVTHEELDITDMVAVSAFFKAIRPQAVLHCAGLSNTGQCEADPLASGRINVQGTENIARACQGERLQADLYEFGSGLCGNRYSGAES